MLLCMRYYLQEERMRLRVIDLAETLKNVFTLFLFAEVL